MAGEEYQLMIDTTRGESKLPVNQEVVVKQLRDKSTMLGLQARVVVRPSFEEYPAADRLFYVSAIHGEEKEPVPVEIVAFLDEDIADVQVLPKAKLTLGERKGTMLSTMLKDREERKRKT
jgi:hypothetical protein